MQPSLSTTRLLPRPFIANHPTLFAQKREVVFAIVERGTSSLVGAISRLNLSLAHARAELGFWIGAGHWSRGYCTEAASEVIHSGHARSCRRQAAP